MKELGLLLLLPEPKLPPHTPASRKPAVGRRRREEVIFYIRALNHSFVLCIFPSVVWLPGRLAELHEEECVMERPQALRD